MSELTGKRKRDMRSGKWEDCSVMELDDTETHTLKVWLYDSHLESFWHRFLTVLGKTPRLMRHYSGIGTNYVYRCSCGVDFDCTDYGSW